MWINMSLTSAKVIFCTKEDHQTPSKYKLPPPLPEEKHRGAILPDGQINWNCPCLGHLPHGPCGYQFREFFSCLHSAKDEPQSCFPKFEAMKLCFKDFPKLYPPDEDELENVQQSSG